MRPRGRPSSLEDTPLSFSLYSVAIGPRFCTRVPREARSCSRSPGSTPATPGACVFKGATAIIKRYFYFCSLILPVPLFNSWVVVNQVVLQQVID